METLPREMVNEICLYLNSLDTCNLNQALWCKTDAPRKYINQRCVDCDESFGNGGECRFFCCLCARHLTSVTCLFCAFISSKRHVCIKCDVMTIGNNWIAQKSIGLNLCNTCAPSVIVHKSRCTLPSTVDIPLHESFYRIADLNRNHVKFMKGIQQAYRCENCHVLMDREKHFVDSKLKICAPCGYDCYTSVTRAIRQYKLNSTDLAPLDYFVILGRYKRVILYYKADITAAAKRKLEDEKNYVSNKKIKLYLFLF